MSPFFLVNLLWCEDEKRMTHSLAEIEDFKHFEKILFKKAK